MSARILCFFGIALMPLFHNGQEHTGLSDHVLYLDDITDAAFTDLISCKIEKSQFVLLGESHGIVEVGAITNHLYNLGKPFGFKTLCIETDSLVATVIEGFFEKDGDAVEAAQTMEQKYPFSIPFYNNYEDYALFENVIASGGGLWGIDQSLMAQFRLSFEYLIQTTQNKDFKARLEQELSMAVEAFRNAVEGKDFMAAYMFKYTHEIHENLISLTQNTNERAILDNLWKSKEIYMYQFSGQYYLNNNTRGVLMKSNFMSYYHQERSKGKPPKVLFKLGYNHAARGLTFTNVYDIGNMVSELAASNDLRSLHIAAMGVSGYENRANPIEKEKVRQKIDYSRYLPSEFMELARDSSHKYVIINLEELRPKAREFNQKIKEFLFKFDLFILINDAQPLTSFKTKT